MIAHIGPMPVEEALPAVLAWGGIGLVLLRDRLAAGCVRCRQMVTRRRNP